MRWVDTSCLSTRYTGLVTGAAFDEVLLGDPESIDVRAVRSVRSLVSERMEEVAAGEPEAGVP